MSLSDSVTRIGLLCLTSHNPISTSTPSDPTPTLVHASPLIPDILLKNLIRTDHTKDERRASRQSRPVLPVSSLLLSPCCPGKLKATQFVPQPTIVIPTTTEGHHVKDQDNEHAYHLNKFIIRRSAWPQQLSPLQL